MIGKVVKPGKGFKGLINYLLRGDRKKQKDPHRVAWIEMRNMLISDPEKVPGLMRATAAKSKRVKLPVYHYVISWHKNEAPSEEIMRQVADTTCADIGLEDYQALYVAHHDTEHRHVHIVVNRVNPETGIAWRTSNDYARIERSLKAQADDLGLEVVPGRHNMRDLNTEPTTRRAKTADRRRAERIGERSRATWSRERVKARRQALELVFDNAASWTDVYQNFEQLGLHLEKKGQGMVITDGDSEMKLSQLGKEHRLNKLIERFGSEEFGNIPEKRQHHSNKNGHGSLHKSDDNEQVKRWEELEKARSVTDLALAFYQFGLMTRAQLAATFAEQGRAQEAFDETKPLREQLLIQRKKEQEKENRKVKRTRRRDRER